MLNGNSQSGQRCVFLPDGRRAELSGLKLPDDTFLSIWQLDNSDFLRSNGVAVPAPTTAQLQETAAAQDTDEVRQVDCHKHNASEAHSDDGSNDGRNPNVQPDVDATGLRPYTGNRAALFLFLHQQSRIRSFLTQRSRRAVIVELGCGVGALTLALVVQNLVSFSVATDACLAGLELARKNSQQNNIPTKLSTIEQLIWGNVDQITLIKERYGPFDLVLGTELLYFNTNVDALVATIASLQNGSGIFLHCGIARVCGIHRLLLDALQRHHGRLWHLSVLSCLGNNEELAATFWQENPFEGLEILVMSIGDYDDMDLLLACDEITYGNVDKMTDSIAEEITDPLAALSLDLTL